MLGMADYIYDHFDEFRLLLDASHDTKFHNFVGGLVSMEEEYTCKWLEATGSRMEPAGGLTAEFFIRRSLVILKASSLSISWRTTSKMLSK